ncbi:YbbR-like domain-containing protein [Maribacter sp. ANRC-HE7]|uniref:YbbR-like domain-containing protein n=1 Tax=Maribacter aquimaris TaxID=2737171 RepID=A0ABR7UYN5_9FLAO|nr:YbbR-like domain-containing protein [Maribacter aquimaris]MBD0776536.1 YbbR-like domain-containing protein [Maribacter aquimaris]
MFLMFLLCSSLIWFLNKLSETYTNNATFNLVFQNIPDSLLLNKVSKKQIDVRIEANGFQFLGFNVKNKEVGVDVSTVSLLKGRYYIPPNVYRKQIDKQLRSMTVLEVDRDTLFFEFTRLGTKVVPVSSRLNISLLQNHILDGQLAIEPKEITIKGPMDIIDTINRVNTVSMDLPDVSSDFIKEVTLYKNPGWANVTYSNNQVVVRGKVSRFSEKVIEVPIKVINLPQRYEIRIFPDKVGVLCRGTLDELKLLNSNGFEVIADYNSITNDESKTMNLKLLKKTDNLQSAELNEKEVEFILRKQ